MDNIDKKILMALQEDARITNQELANRAGLSPSACLRRVQSLEQNGMIDTYTALFNEAKVGYTTQIILQVTLDEQGADKLEEFEKAVVEIPQVISCFLMGGGYDYLMRVAVKDINDYEELHRTKLSELPNISALQSNFVMRKIVNRINPIL